MAKRFTDTAIWEKEWFMKLSPKHKCLFRYLVDRCDACGVWEPNWHLATIYIGEKVDVSDLMVMNDQVEKLPNGKYFIVGFTQFQYGELSENCKPHQKVIGLLKKHQLFERVCKGYTKGIQRVEEKEEEEEEDKEEEEEKDRGQISSLVFGDKQWYEGLLMTHKGKDILQAWNECYNHHIVKPFAPKTAWEWRQKLNTWLSIAKPERKRSNEHQRGKFVQ